MDTIAHDAVVDSETWLQVGCHSLRSRLLVGIEQYTDAESARIVLEAAEADVLIITYDLDNTRSSLLLSDLDQEIHLDRYVQIGTTSFATSADVAVRTAHRLREWLGIDVIKLDVRTLANAPDTEATMKAAKQLLRDGFTLLPFILPEPDTARAFEDLGCAAIRLMASPVASYQGIVHPEAIRRSIEHLAVPAIIEGGIGSPTHAVRAFELGAAAVLVNTLIARSKDPAGMAAALRHAVLAGRLASGSR